jgi:hypothetical protein
LIPRGTSARARKRAPSGPSVSPDGGRAWGDKKASHHRDRGRARRRDTLARGGEVVPANAEEVRIRIGPQAAAADVFLDQVPDRFK